MKIKRIPFPNESWPLVLVTQSEGKDRACLGQVKGGPVLQDLFCPLEDVWPYPGEGPGCPPGSAPSATCPVKMSCWKSGRLSFWSRTTISKSVGSSRGTPPRSRAKALSWWWGEQKEAHLNWGRQPLLP